MMERKKLDSADVYWESSHAGFDFSGNDYQISVGDSKSSAVMRDDELNELDLLRSDGLTEVVENRSSEDFLLFNISQVKNERYASELTEHFNPVIQKRQKENIECGPEETVKNMILGLIVLYMRDTLKKSIFQREIVQYLDAVNVYLAYLEEDHETDELTNMLLLLKRTEDAAVLKYQAALIVQDLQMKRKWIENCLSTHLQMESSGSFFHQSIAEHLLLLDDHINSQIYYPHIPTNETDNNTLRYEKLTGKKSVIDSSVLCSLIFCSLWYHTGSELIVHETEKLKNNFKMSEKQYTWGVLRALSASEKWMDIDYLFISKNWLGAVKVRSCITISRILEVLFKAKAPIEVLKKYVSFVENEDERLMLARKYACHSVVIEVYKNNKDRAALKNYLPSLLPNTVDFYTAKEILNNPAMRWKN